MEADLLNPNLCTSCGHSGKLHKHTKSGCIECGTVIKCKDTYKEKRALILNEIQIIKKTRLKEDFPDQELLDEFLIRKHSVPSKLDLEWKQPQIDKYIDFVDKYLTWDPQYAFDKIFPLATRWQLRYLPNISSDMYFSINNLFIPEKIKKVRNIKSIASYEIIWTDTTGIREKLKINYDISDKENNDDDITNNELVTIEPQDIVLKCYPDLVESFETEKNKKKPPKRTANKRQRKLIKDKNINTIKEGNAKKSQRKTKKKLVEDKNNRKIDEFILQNPPLSLEESFERMSITPKRSKQGCDSIENNVKENIDRNFVKYSKDGVKHPPQMRRVLELEKVNIKLDNTLDRMFLELSPEDFTSETEDADLNMTGIIDSLCNRYNFQDEYRDNEISNIIKSDSDNVIVSTSNQNLVEDMGSAKYDSIKCDHDVSITKCTMNDIPDEFDDIESYVPIYERIQRRCKKDTNRKSKRFSIARCSFDFDALMNETDIENI